MVIPFILGFFRVLSRDFHLAHSPLDRAVGSWAAVEANGMGLPSTGTPPRLGATLIKTPPPVLQFEPTL
jgi:hypothetical protein